MKAWQYFLNTKGSADMYSAKKITIIKKLSLSQIGADSDIHSSFEFVIYK